MPSGTGDGRAAAYMRWPAVLLLGCALVAVAVVSVLPTVARRHDYATLRRSGVTTVARIDYCDTATGGHPAVVTVTCPGTFTVDGHPVTRDILGLPGPLEEGTTVVVSVDPADTGVVYPLADVRTGYQSGWLTGRTALAVFALVLVALLVWRQLLVARRRRGSAPPPVAGRTT